MIFWPFILNCIKIEQIDDPVLPVEAIVKRCNKHKLSELYKIGEFEDTLSFLNLVAQARGKILQGGVSDINGAAKLVLKDWNKGKIPYYTIPPEDTGIQLETTIVSDWGKEFDFNTVMDFESKVLEDLIDTDKNYTPIPSKKNNYTLNLENMKVDDTDPESNVVMGELKLKKKDDEPNKKRKLNDYGVFQINKDIRKTISETKKKEYKENILQEGKPEIIQENYSFDSSFWESEEDKISTTQESFTF